MTETLLGWRWIGLRKQARPGARVDVMRLWSVVGAGGRFGGARQEERVLQATFARALDGMRKVHADALPPLPVDDPLPESNRASHTKQGCPFDTMNLGEERTPPR